MTKFINTVDLLGDDAVFDRIVSRTITEFADDRITVIGRGAFSGCTQLTDVNCPNVVNIELFAFEGCTAPLSVYCPKTEKLSGGAFVNSAISHVAFPALLQTYNTTGSMDPFSNCTALVVADLGAIQSMVAPCFVNCVNLKAVILRRGDVCLLKGSNAFQNSSIVSGIGYIYVPRALVEDYKVATNWSVYADQFRALEDYTVDGTITGELDETKI